MYDEDSELSKRYDQIERNRRAEEDTEEKPLLNRRQRCEICGTKMLPNMLNEYKTGNVVAVHVCPECGLVTRDTDGTFVDMFHHDQYRVQDEWRNDGRDIGE